MARDLRKGLVSKWRGQAIPRIRIETYHGFTTTRDLGILEDIVVGDRQPSRHFLRLLIKQLTTLLVSFVLFLFVFVIHCFLLST